MLLWAFAIRSILVLILIIPPSEQAVGNIVRRVLKTIRETIKEDLNDASEFTINDNDEFGSDQDDEENSTEEEEHDDGEDETTRRRQPTESSSMFNLLRLVDQPAPEVDYTKRNYNILLLVIRIGLDFCMFLFASICHNIVPLYCPLNEMLGLVTLRLKPILIQVIQEEVMAELEVIYKGVSDQALEHIHSE